ncbi:hypothetical protein [Propylenella binzhouense]|uniref:Uncharacterized protein n=1 Tax=Propylenella binzhouense TaxID=2555902 RepID=A0A964T6I5_9HYPH|nr:hypothetical protein [Propylenella binzhouense]MYZ49030.1 hypothetical protein [Propylenella binzhouense]
MNGDAAGLRILDISVEGFWRSFAAILFVVLFSLPVLVAEPTLLAGEGGQATATRAPMLLQIVAILVDWVAFPLIFAALARPLGLGGQYVPYIVGRNWSSVIVSGIYAAVLVPYLLGVLPAGIVPYLLFAVFGLALRFSYLVARIALGVPASLAVPIVVLEVLVSLVVEFTLGRSG